MSLFSLVRSGPNKASTWSSHTLCLPRQRTKGEPYQPPATSSDEPPDPPTANSSSPSQQHRSARQQPCAKAAPLLDADLTLKRNGQIHFRFTLLTNNTHQPRLQVNHRSNGRAPVQINTTPSRSLPYLRPTNTSLFEPGETSAPDKTFDMDRTA